MLFGETKAEAHEENVIPTYLADAYELTEYVLLKFADDYENNSTYRRYRIFV